MNWLADVPEDDAEHFTAQAAMNYFLSVAGRTLDDVAVSPAIVITWQQVIFHHLVSRTGAENADSWMELNRCTLAHGRMDGRDVTIVLMPIGAPQSVTILEYLAIGGARTVVAVGAAGSLQDYAPIGAAVVPVRAIREEGTSYHYAPPETPALPDAGLVAELQAACREAGMIPHSGPVWTTDAPFRELTSKVRRFAADGVVAVDMEASALYVVGAQKGVRIASLLVVSDELFHPWTPAFRDRGYRLAARRIADVALKVALAHAPPARAAAEAEHSG